MTFNKSLDQGNNIKQGFQGLSVVGAFTNFCFELEKYSLGSLLESVLKKNLTESLDSPRSNNGPTHLVLLDVKLRYECDLLD